MLRGGKCATRGDYHGTGARSDRWDEVERCERERESSGSYRTRNVGRAVENHGNCLGVAGYRHTCAHSSMHVLVHEELENQKTKNDTTQAHPKRGTQTRLAAVAQAAQTLDVKTFLRRNEV